AEPYALTNPQHAPWGVPHRLLFHDVPCRFCYQSVCPEGHHECLRLVPPRLVADAARSLACPDEGVSAVRGLDHHRGNELLDALPATGGVAGPISGSRGGA